MPAESLHVFVVDLADAVHAERAYLSSRTWAATSAEPARPASISAVAILTWARTARTEPAGTRISVNGRTGLWCPGISFCHGQNLFTRWSY
jgi:hypothetical protein